MDPNAKYRVAAFAAKRVADAAELRARRVASDAAAATAAAAAAAAARDAIMRPFVAARAAAIAAGAMWRRRLLALALVCIVAAGLARAARMSATANVSVPAADARIVTACDYSVAEGGVRVEGGARDAADAAAAACSVTVLTMRATALFACAAAARAAAANEFVALFNAAQPGQTMPAIGLGTGGYGTTKKAYGNYPECWMEIAGCGNFTERAVEAWLAMGGRRLDAADSYDTQTSVGAAMAASGVPRGDIFLLQKTGNWNPMGYADTLSQFSVLLAQMKTPYVDLLLNHWPTSPASPTVDPLCDPEKHATYDAKGCRLSTWRAYVEIFNNGTAKSIGVANYNTSHLQEIIDAGMPLPSVNQVPYHLYNAAAQAELLAFCTAHKIVVLSYSPLGIPDWHAFPTPALPASTTLRDPVLLSVAAAHAPATPAQVTLAWLWAQGVPSNPRSMSPAHMAENLAALGAVTLTPAEMSALSSRPIDYCAADNSFYECVPAGGYLPGAHPLLVRRA